MKTMILALTAFLLTQQQARAEGPSLADHQKMAGTFDQGSNPNPVISPAGQSQTSAPLTLQEASSTPNQIGPNNPAYTPVRYIQGQENEYRPISKAMHMGSGIGVLAGALTGAIVPLAIEGFTLTGGFWAAAGFFGGALTGGLAGLVIGFGIGLLMTGIFMKGRKIKPTIDTASVA